MEREARDAAFKAAPRTLGGHGRRSPRAVLEEVAASIGQDEEGDRYGDGALVQDFEREVAETLGQEAALYFPTGTMAQQVALRIWSERCGSRNVAFHPTCHLETHEGKAYERLHGLHGVHVGNPRSLITLDDLQSITDPLAALLLELPQREIGGQLPDWDALRAQTEWARERGAAVHMDGARLWESAPFYDRQYAEIAALFDSVYVSFYKTLGALAGAALAGPSEFIDEARIWRRRHGGAMFQFYPYVASARLRFRERLPRVPIYVARADAIADILREIDGIEIRPDPPQTNMMHLFLRGDRDELLDRSAEIASESGLLLFAWLTPSDLPGWQMTEISIGESALALSDDEIREGFSRVVA